MSRLCSGILLAGSLLLALLVAQVGPTAVASRPSRPNTAQLVTGDAGDARVTPVLQSVLSPPRWFTADDGRVHLEYEILLTNAVSLPMRVTALDVLSGSGAEVTRLSGDRLRATMGWQSGQRPTTELKPFTVDVVWINLTFSKPNALPRRVKQRLTVALPPTPGAPAVIEDTSTSFSISRRVATVIAPPLRGGRWVAVVGPHREALLPVNGAWRLGQRFAIDFSALLNGRGQSHNGEANRNTSYFNYGQPVLAVGPGTIVRAVDRYPNQIPNHNQPVDLGASDGNFVVIKLARGVFAGYAHLAPGSVRVHAGQRVRAGQILGLLGNSGNSSGPHLHFQLMTRPSLLDSDGLPFLLHRFRLEGRVPSLKTFLDADLAGTPMPIEREMAGQRRHEGFMNLDVVTF